jgi:sulfite exporter TauE/SafE
MLASISPVGEASRRQRWTVTVTAYALSSALAGTLVGGLLGAVGSVLGAGGWGRWALVVLGAATLSGAVLDARRTSELPSWRRQVDERWLTTYRGWVYGAGYGFQLGAAVLTIVSSAMTYAALLAALLTGSPGAGALIGLTFGAVRSVPLLLTVGIRSPRRLQDLHRRLDAATRPVALAGIGAQAAIGFVAAGAAVLRVPT